MGSSTAVGVRNLTAFKRGILWKGLDDVTAGIYTKEFCFPHYILLQHFLLFF